MKRLFGLGLLSLVLGLILPLAMGPAANAETFHHKLCTTPIIAHRGSGIGDTVKGGHELTENTIPALLWGALVADGAEMDLWPDAPTLLDPAATTPPDGVVTPNGVVQLVINHDPRLDRTTNGTGLIVDRTWQYIQSIRADSGAEVPTFSQVQQALNTKRPGKQQQLEMKPVYAPDFVQYMVDLVHQYRTTRAALAGVMFTSGYVSNLKLIKQDDSRLKTGLIGYGMHRPSIAKLRSYVYIGADGRKHHVVDSVNVNQGAPVRYIRRLHHYGFKASLRRPDTLRQFRADVRKDADQVVTDKPGLLARAC